MVRFKNRYVLAELKFEDRSVDTTLSTRQISSALQAVVLTLYGDFGLGLVQQSLTLKYFNVETGLVVVRCARDHHDILLAAVSSLSAIGKRRCAFQTLHLGGSIRSCQKAAIKHNRHQLLLLHQKATLPHERERIATILAQTEKQLTSLQY